MLRLGFLPSDFNPMLLMLGETEDLRALGGVLRRFARQGGTVALDELAFCAAWRTRVMLTDAGTDGVLLAGCIRWMARDVSFGGWMRPGPWGLRIWWMCLRCQDELPARRFWRAGARTRSR
jgi:hypothetical protein